MQNIITTYQTTNLN